MKSNLKSTLIVVAVALSTLTCAARANAQAYFGVIEEAIMKKAKFYGLGAPDSKPAGPQRLRSGERGYRQLFERGAVYWLSEQRIYVVMGTIFQTYRERNLDDGELGAPLTDELSCGQLDPQDRLSVFRNGRIYWDHATNRTYVVPGSTQITADGSVPFDGTGTCFPRVKTWLDAGTFVWAFPAGNISMWGDRVYARPGAGTLLGQIAVQERFDLQPHITQVNGFQAVRFAENQGMWTPVSLANTPYTIFAVVQRDSDRGENYFLKSEGLECGITGCADNSALHLGWQGDRTIRFGQYYNDVDLPNVPAFNRDRAVISVITAYSDNTEKFVRLDEAGFSNSARKQDARLLRPGAGRLNLAASNYPPDYRFGGSVLELIVCDYRLPDFIIETMRRNLCVKYRACRS